MTDAPGQLMLPIDESLPKERLRRSMLLLVGAAVVLIHLLLITVFTPLKPDPAIVQMIFKSYASLNGDSIPKAVMVGDSSSDIRTGKNAGISTIAVTWGYRSASSLGEADIMVHNVEELRAALLIT